MLLSKLLWHRGETAALSNLIKIVGWSPHSQAIAVFVHGLGGHAYDTWRLQPETDINSDSTFWPKWLAEDIPGLDVFSLSYSAPASRWTGNAMSFYERATEMRSVLSSNLALNNKPIFFICHSLGGLVVKQLLLDLDQRTDSDPTSKTLLQQVKHIAFLATPHFGSMQASWLDRLRLFAWPSQNTHELQEGSAALKKLNDSYRVMSAAHAKSLSHSIYYETLGTEAGVIVSEWSADPGLQVEPIPIDANHITIAKPGNKTSSLYLSLKSQLKALTPTTKVPVARADIRLERLPTSEHVPVLPRAIRAIFVLALSLMFSVFAWRYLIPQEKEDFKSLDAVDKIALFALISDKEERVRVAGLLERRELSNNEKELIASLSFGENNLPEESQRITEAVVSAKSSLELEEALAGVKVPTCDGTATFSVKENYLTCSNGIAIPRFPISKNVGGQLASLEAVILHSTGSDSLESDLHLFLSENIPGSTHLLIGRNGAVVQLVPFNRVAWHAGVSEWQERSLVGLNQYSIGISLSNSGELKKTPEGNFANFNHKSVMSSDVFVFNDKGSETYWMKYTDEQIHAVEGIVRAIAQSYPKIGLLTHSEISPGRKTDPGPAFPTERLRQELIAINR